MSIIAGQFADEGVYGAELLSGVSALSRLQNVEQVVDRYRRLRDYYYAEELYPGIARLLQLNPASAEAQALRKRKALRNPTHAVVEFYAATLLSGELTPQAENEAILGPIDQVWNWSNWDARKPVFSRSLAMLGDQFVKVATRLADPNDPMSAVQRVFFQLIDPSLVTWFDTDERGYLTFIRLDIPQWRGQAQAPFRITHTEVWDKASGLYQVWERPGDVRMTQLANLGTPDEEREIAKMVGSDFVPVVHVKFRDVGEPRGLSAFEHALPPIHEADHLATELHEKLMRYNKADWGLTSPGRDPEGRTVMPPGFENPGQPAQATEVKMGDEQMFAMPAGWQLGPLTAQINYDAALRVLQDQMSTIEHYFLPELAYYKINELRDVSGRAIRFMLSGAIDRVLEARANAEGALARLDAMALTIGQHHGLFDQSIGVYEATDPAQSFDHTFEPRPVIPTSDLEESQAELARGQAAVAWTQAGVPLAEVLRQAGIGGMPMSEEDIDRVRQDAATEAGLQPATNPPLNLAFPGNNGNGRTNGA